MQRAATVDRTPTLALASLVAGRIGVLNGAVSKVAEQTRANEPFELALQAVAQRRDRQAFALVFRHFAPRVKSYLLRLGTPQDEAEELMQEAMANVWRRAASYDPAKAAVSTWVFTIARNLAIDSFRRSRRAEVDFEDPSLEVDAPEPPDRRLLANQSARQLKDALEHLPEEQLEIVRLAYFDDRSQSRIARELGVPLGTVKSRLRLALGRLRKALDEEVLEP